jgi:nucleoside-diphosphate-sugar epimerase
MPKRILVTGASGKVGQAFLKRILESPDYEDFIVRTLLHNRTLPARERLETVRGSIDDRAFVEEAMRDVTHVLHLATVKETPEAIMAVAVKGMFWLLEACRVSPTFQQFILIGGDAAVGHSVYPHPIPVTETQHHSAYEGCYALSKVLEEVMLEQYYIQYDLNGCCLRAPWIMEKDDFKYTLSFGDDVFGGPPWKDFVTPEQAAEYIRTQTVPVMIDRTGRSVKRNFVHVEDLVSAILLAIDAPGAQQQTFNICMDEPVDYREMGAYLAKTRGLPTVEIVTPLYPVWLDNAKAKFVLGWRPQYDLAKLIDAAWDYQRAADDPRIVWYPG